MKTKQKKNPSPCVLCCAVLCCVCVPSFLPSRPDAKSVARCRGACDLRPFPPHSRRCRLSGMSSPTAGADPCTSSGEAVHDRWDTHDDSELHHHHSPSCHWPHHHVPSSQYHRPRLSDPPPLPTLRFEMAAVRFEMAAARSSMAGVLARRGGRGEQRSRVERSGGCGVGDGLADKPWTADPLASRRQTGISEASQNAGRWGQAGE